MYVDIVEKIKIRVIYGTDPGVFSEGLWDILRDHLAVSLIYHTECIGTIRPVLPCFQSPLHFRRKVIELEGRRTRARANCCS